MANKTRLKHAGKRGLSFFLALVMCISLVQITAFAADTSQIMAGNYEIGADNQIVTNEHGAANIVGDTVTEDGFTLTKKISAASGDNQFNVTLQVVTQQVVTTKDAAVMIIIDNSGSMRYCAKCGAEEEHTEECEYYEDGDDVKSSQSRMTATIDALKKEGGFIDTLVSNNKKNNGGRIYVSVVKFDTTAETICGWTDITSDTGAATVKDTINSKNLDADGGTNLEAGLLLARNRLGMSDISGVAAENKYTVLLTDGAPTYRVSDNSKATSTEEAGTPGKQGQAGTGGNTNDGSGRQTSEAERNEAKDVATEVKDLSKLYTICYGVSGDTLYTVVKCANCGKTEAQHVELCSNCGKAKSEHTYKYHNYYCNGVYIGAPKYNGRLYCDSTRANQYKATTVTVTVGDYLRNEIATPATGDVTYAFDAGDDDEINKAFESISESSTSGMTGGGTTVTDPMGDYIILGDVSNLADQGVVKNGSNGITWTLDPENASKTTQDGVTTYTYTITYPITLDTAAEGFEEDVYYPTNKYTYLQVGDKKLAFTVPGVKGDKPLVSYTIEYYKMGEDGTYPDNPTDSETYDNVELWSKVTAPDGYETKYGENYTVSGDTVMTLSWDGMTMKLYYALTPVSVVVNHYVVTETETDDDKVVTGPALRNTKTYPEETDKLWKGAKFTNTYFLNLQNCEQVDEVTVGGTTYTTDKFENVELKDDRTVINIYYFQKVNARTPADYEVHYFYRDSAWTLVDGKYQLTYGDYTEELSQKIGSKGYLNDQVSFPDYSKLNTAYSLDEIRFNGDDNDDKYTITLGSGANVVNVYYTKASEDTRVPAELTIVHLYYKKTISGDVFEKAYFEENNKKVYVGETYTASDLNESGTYTRQTADLSITIQRGSNFKEVVYLRDARVPVTVIENHYYTDYEWTVDRETGEGEWVEKTTSKQPDMEGLRVTGKYEGETYVPRQITAGYTLNTDCSDEEGRVLTAGENVFNMYYESYVGEEVVADVTVNHIYQTYTTYINSDGEIVRELNSKTVSEDTVYGVPGDSFTAKIEKVDDFKFVTADTSDLKVTLVGENGQYNIYYEKEEDLREVTNVVVQPVYKTYTTELDGTVVLSDIEKSEAVNLEGTYYVGQKVTVATSAYAKDGFTYDPDDAENTPNATIEHLGAGDNGILLVYKEIRDDRVPASVVIRNYYTLVTKTSDENGVYSESEDTWHNTGAVTGGYYVGQTFDTTGKGTSNGYDVDTREGITQPEDTITLSQQITYVDFYWYKEVDQTNPAKVEVVHHYTIEDANPNGQDITWTEGAHLDQLGDVFYVGQHFVATPNYQGGIFDESNITKVTPEGAIEGTGIVLGSGENVIDIYYVKNIDTRVSTTATVIHNYYHDGDDLTEGKTEASYTETASVLEADSYTATLRTENGGLAYTFDSADPANYTITVNKDAAKNVITINYVRTEANYRVVHEYYTDGKLDGSIFTRVGAKVGDVISAADITKVTAYEGKSYDYTSATPASITVTDDFEATITLRYDRETKHVTTKYYDVTVNYLDKETGEKIAESHEESIRKGRTYDVTAYDAIEIEGYTYDKTTGDPLKGTMNKDKVINVYYVKTTDISEPEVPGEELPTIPTDPDQPSDVENPDVPRADAPKTGDATWLWAMAAAVSGMGLVWLTISGKKRKEEDA
ncbi:VWA domain-containing protein [Dysosmobacter sp. Sow4_B12]|uniref:VWA domain-containing protein n=1 Tax=Dysosmobacter sp. Sow4_B12 TaxID=3438777 RepID=UPI003F8E960B